MAITRRGVLLQGSAIGAGLVATNITGIEVLAQQAPRRRSISELSPNDPIVEALREGVGRLREGSGRVTWASIAAIHGNEQSFNRCPHGSWYFLPWHRAYTVMFENIIREVSGMREFALPYWDWTRERTIPRVFAEENVRGRRNPLYEPSRQFQGRLADENVGQRVIDEITRERNFEVFGSSRPRGQNNTDGSWVQRRTGNQGPLESNPHNTVHGAVAGLMGSSASANDPIFWMHHCNVDRLWALWNAKGNQNTTDRLWTEMVFRDHFLNPNGRAYSATVKDMQDTQSLGFVYDGISTQAARTLAQQPTRAVQQERERFVTAMTRIGGEGETRRSLDQAANIPVFSSEAGGSAEAQRPLAVPVRIDRELITRSFRASGGQPGASGDETTTRGSDRDRRTERPAERERERDNDGKPLSMQDLAEGKGRDEYGNQERRPRENDDAYGRNERTERDQYGRTGRDGRDGPDGEDDSQERPRRNQGREQREETADDAAAPAAKPRAVAFIESLECSRSETTQVRVFVDCDYLNQSTPITDDHYVGTFGFFGKAEEHGGSHGTARPSVLADLSEALEKLYKGKPPGEEIRVQLQPITNYGESSEIGDVSPARITIAFV